MSELREHNDTPGCNVLVTGPCVREVIMLATERCEDVTPVCPHCKGNVTRILFRELESDWGRRLVYFCPECHCVLGVSHRKGPMFGI
jgi:hypothetical protein